MAFLKFPLLLSLSPLALGGLVPAPHIPTITPIPAPIAGHHINRREAWPESVTALIPQKIDQRYFSIDENGNTQAKVSDHFSTVEVSVSKRENIGVQIATAAVGIYKEKLPSGANELSLEITPDILKKIESFIKAWIKTHPEDEEIPEIIEAFNPKLRPAAEAVANILNEEAGPSFIGVQMGGEPLAAVAVEGTLPAGVASAVAVGEVLVPYVSFVTLMAWQWAGLVVALSKSPQLKLPHSIVINEADLPSEQHCQGEKPKCKSDSCKGDLFICSVEPHCKFLLIYTA